LDSFSTRSKEVESVIALAVGIPLSLASLLASLALSSRLGRSAEPGSSPWAVTKCAILVLGVNAVMLMPFGGWIALVVWWVGLRGLFRLDPWEGRTVVLFNWAFNLLARALLLGAILS
jgi:hypothetical protein